MSSRTRAFFVMALVLMLLALGTSSAFMAPKAPDANVTFGSITVGCGVSDPTNPGFAKVRITAQNVGGGGIAAFSLAVQLTGAEVVSAVAGSGWTGTGAACSPNFTPFATGGAFYALTGTCTASPIPDPALTGADVELAVMTVRAPGGGALVGPYTVSLVTQEPFFTIKTEMAAADQVRVPALANQLLAACTPTAVTMSGFDATTDSPAPFAAAAWPLLAGAAAVAAGGAYALLRRKS